MQTFSTPRVALLPQATNLVTVAVLVAATWWSGAQRPVDPAALTAQAAPATTKSTPAAAQPQRPLAAAAQTTAAAPWPAQGHGLISDGLQAVGYQPRTTR